jgi:DNA repair protein RadC
MKVKITPKEIKILNSKDLYAVMQKVLLRENKIDRDKEHFWIIGLANNNTILYIELISLGTVKSVPVEPMEVFSIALQKRTVQIMMVHNHPSGELHPSADDRDITDRMIQVGEFLQIPVLDHLIITEKGYLSFLDTGLMSLLKKDSRYVLPYKEQERLLKAAEKIGESRGRKAREREMARVLKAKGIKTEVIAEATGLKLAEVKRLKA